MGGSAAELSIIVKARDQASRALGRIGGAAAGMGKAIRAASMLAVAAGAALGIMAIRAAADFEGAYNTIRRGTGATGEALEALKEDFKATLRDVPEDMATVASATADLNTRLGLTGPPLRAMTKQFLDFARVTDTEVASAVAAGTRAFGDWSIAAKDQGDALDYVFKAAQSTGIQADVLLQKIVSYGAPMRQFGFSFEESAALMGKWEKEGVNAEAILGALKIGVANFAKEGVPMKEGLQNLITEMQILGPGADATRLAIEKFGSRAGPDMAAAITECRFSLDELMGTLEASSETIKQAAADTLSLGDRFGILKNKALVAAEPVLTEMLEGLTRALARVMPYVEEYLPRGIDAIRSAFLQARPYVLAFTESFKTGLDTLRPAVEWLFNFIIDNKPVLVAAIAAIGLAIVVAFGPVSIAIAAIVGLIAAIGWIRDNWDMLKRETERILGAIAAFMQDVFASAANAVIGTFEFLVNKIISHLNRLATPFNTMIALFNKITGMDVGALQLGKVDFGRVGWGGAGGAGGAGLDEGFIDWGVIVDALSGDAAEAGEQVGAAMGEGVGEGIGEALGSGGAGAAAAQDAFDYAAYLVRQGMRAWLAAVEEGVRAGTVTIQTAFDYMKRGMEDAGRTIIDALAAQESEIERAWAIIAATIERGVVRFQDIRELMDLGAFGQEVADDFIAALRGESSRIGDAIFEAAADAAAEAAQESAEAFIAAYTDAIATVGDLMAGISGEVGRLVGADTEESLRERLRMLELEQEKLGLVAVVEGQRAAHLEALAAAEEQLAEARKPLVALEDEIAKRERGIAKIREEIREARGGPMREERERLEQELAKEERRIIVAERMAKSEARRYAMAERDLGVAEEILTEEQKQLQAIEDEIAALQALAEARQIEREIAEIQWRLTNEQLLTDKEVLEQIEAQTAAMDELRGVLEILNDGVLDALDVFALLSLGLDDLTQHVLEIIAGLVPAPAGIAGAQGGPALLGAGTPAPVQHIHIHQMIVNGNSREIMREIGGLVN